MGALPEKRFLFATLDTIYKIKGYDKEKRNTFRSYKNISSLNSLKKPKRDII